MAMCIPPHPFAPQAASPLSLNWSFFQIHSERQTIAVASLPLLTPFPLAPFITPVMESVHVESGRSWSRPPRPDDGAPATMMGRIRKAVNPRDQDGGQRPAHQSGSLSYPHIGFSKLGLHENFYRNKATVKAPAIRSSPRLAAAAPGVASTSATAPSKRGVAVVKRRTQIRASSPISPMLGYHSISHSLSDVSDPLSDVSEPIRPVRKPVVKRRPIDPLLSTSLSPLAPFDDLELELFQPSGLAASSSSDLTKRKMLDRRKVFRPTAPVTLAGESGDDASGSRATRSRPSSLVSLADDHNVEAEFDGSESESESDCSGDSESSMEWEEDAGGVKEHEQLAALESDDDSDDAQSFTSIVDLPLRIVNSRYLEINRKLNRLQGVRTRAKAVGARSRRLDDHLHAERYTSMLYRRLLRKTQLELSEEKTSRVKAVRDYHTVRSQREELRAGLEVSRTRNVLLSAEKASAEKERDREKKQEAAERELKEARMILLRADIAKLEREGADAKEEAEQRYAAVNAEKEAEERKRIEVEEGLRVAKLAKEEGNRKLAMIREAHDFERTSYLEQIRFLREQLRVKIEQRE